MATYGTDLTDITDAESGGTWAEMTNYTAGDIPAEGETDYFIQGLSCASTDTNNKTGLASGCFDYGSSLAGSFTDGSTVVLVWHVLLPGNAMDTYSAGGLRAIVGASTSQFGAWYVGGSDFGRNPYGGWQCYAVDPSTTPDDNVGTFVPGSAGSGYRYFGAGTLLTAAISKGTMHGFDAMRYGRGEIYCTSTGCTFAGMAQYNDYNDVTNGYNRYGLFQAQGGSYLWKGLLSIGQSGTSATFSDSNRTIVIDDTPAVYSSFNRIAIRNASTSVTWNNISIQALGTTSPGELEVVENATVSFDGCTFQNMNTFTFLSNSTVSNCIFKTCGLITTNGADLSTSRVLTPNVVADAVALDWDVATDPDGYLDDMTYSIGATAHHAIGFGTSAPTTMTIRGCTFSGFNASDGQNDSTLYFEDKGSDTTWTVYVTDCTGNISYKKARAGDTVNLVFDTVDFTLTGLVADTEVKLYRTSDGVLLDGTESSSTSWTYNYTYTSDIGVYVVIFHLQYKPIYLTGLTLGNTDQSILIQQIYDRVYSNP